VKRNFHFLKDKYIVNINLMIEYNKIIYSRSM
jgi:hypothetical protein